MTMMDYFRRPNLAGNNITRTTRATVRGNLRRSDADGSSTVPYFPGAVSGLTLLVSVDGAAATTITLTDANAAGSGIVTALADINTALSPGGEALDTDGTITLRSTNAVGGSIEVTGGTAAAALGFDITLGHFRAANGQIPSTPESRLGDWYGVSFPSRNEGLTAESVNRGLARLSANSDVLHSEHMRGDVLPRKTTYSFLSGDRQRLTLPTATRIFTGKGFLSNTSTKEELARYFYLVDQATGLPPASRVVAVVRNSPAVTLPVANATTWFGGTAVGNVLGQDLAKVTATIALIKNGRVIGCTGANFISVGKVLPGDYVEISGATNTSPWSNNGNRWVVEEVLSEDTIAVRPMSNSELVQFGVTTAEEQPIIELNGGTSGLGTCTVRTGTFCNDAQVIVDPPIPVGATYDLYISTPGDLRNRQIPELQAKDIQHSFSASDLRPEPNALLVPPTVSSWTGASVVLSGGYARFSGRVVSIPARTILAADFTAGVVQYVYWDKDANDVKVTGSHVKVVNSDPTLAPGSSFPTDTQASQHLIAEVWKTGSNIVSVLYEGKALAEEVESRVITVGIGGQFSKLEEAVRFINRWAKGNNFRSSTYPQFEIVVVSDTVIDLSTIVGGNNTDYPTTHQIFFDCPVKVRGARPGVVLSLKNWTLGTPFDFGWTSGGTYIFEDLNITVDGSMATTAPIFGRSNTTVIFKNVTTTGSMGYFAGFVGDLLVIDSCKIVGLKQSFIFFGNAASNFEIINSKIQLSSTPATVPVIFGSSLTPFSCNSLTVRDCEFSNLSTDQGYAGWPLMGKFQTSTLFDNCRFLKNGSNTAGVDSVLFRHSYSSGRLIVSRCTSLAATRCFIDTDSQDHCIVENCEIQVEPDQGALINPGVRASVVKNCSIVCNTTGSVQAIVEPLRSASGNFITSVTSSVGIRTPALFTVGIDISNNHVAMTGASSKGIQVTSTNTEARIIGNYVTSDGVGLDFLSPPTGSARYVAGNYFSGTTAGVALLGCHDFVGNYVSGPVTSPTTGVTKNIAENTFQGAVTLNGAGSDYTVLSKNYFAALVTSGGTYITMSNNTFNAGLTCTTSSIIRLSENVISGVTSVTTSGELHVWNNAFNGNATLSGTPGANPVTIDWNTFGGSLTVADVDRFCGNIMNSGGGSSITINGSQVNTSSGPVPAVGNTIITGGTCSFTGLQMADLRFQSFAGTATFTNCQLDGSYLSSLVGFGGAFSFVNSNLSSCKIDDAASITVNNAVMMGCSFLQTSGIVPFTIAGGATGGLYCVGCVWGGSGFATINYASTASGHAEFANCHMGGNTSITMAGSNPSVRMSGCSMAQLSISGGSSVTDVSVSNCTMTGNMDVLPGGGGGHTYISNCSTGDTTLSHISGASAVEVRACHFSGPLQMSGFAPAQTLVDCVVIGGVTFVNDASSGSYLRFEIANNIITSAANVHGLAFPAYGNSSFNGLSITGNYIGVADGTSGGGNVVQASCIYFAGKISNVCITGNRLTTGNGSADPGGTGSFTYGMIQMDGATGASNSIVISSNRFSMGPGSAGWNFRTGALLITYKYLKFTEFQSSGGAGNIMTENLGLATNSAPFNGGTFFNTTGVAYTL